MTNSLNGKDPKAAIIHGAFAALKKSGLPTMSYDDIASEAGVSRQVVKYHFQNPESLMIALCDAMALRYRETLISGVIKAEGSARLNLFMDFYFDLLSDMPKPRDDQVYDAMMSLSAASPKIRDTLRTQYSLLGHVLSNEFQLQYPGLSHQSSAELSYLFVCLMYGHWKMVASLGFSEDHKHITRRAMDRLIESYAKTHIELGPEMSVWVKNDDT